MKFLNGWTKKKMIKHIEENFKGKSISRDGKLCLYKTAEGKKCAVGLFIPQKRREQFDLAGSVYNLLTEYPDLKKAMPIDEDSLYELQVVHDKGDFELPPFDNRTDNEVLMDLISFIESETD